jgi:hypothetical protein
LIDSYNETLGLNNLVIWYKNYVGRNHSVISYLIALKFPALTRPFIPVSVDETVTIFDLLSPILNIFPSCCLLS